MRSPRTAKDDHAGPIGLRHSCTGGDADQLVGIRTPRTTPSRARPRKPGHSARVTVRSLVAGPAASGATAGAPGPAGLSPAPAAIGALGTSAGAEAGGTGLGSVTAWASSRSSGVGDHRQ